MIRPSLLSYTGSENLGDAIQTAAMLRLINGPCTYRDRDTGHGANPSEVHLLNGFLDGRWRPGPAVKTVFAGVHVTHPVIAKRVAQIAGDELVGARDPHSLELLKAVGANVVLTGCATLTLPPYTGRRSGVLHIDDGHPDQLTQYIPSNAPWTPQFWRAKERLLLLERAELVHTTRLHVALPCLASGTPVQMPADTLKRVHEPGRLSLLDTIGFEYGKPQVIDITIFRERFLGFMAQAFRTEQSAD